MTKIKIVEVTHTEHHKKSVTKLQFLRSGTIIKMRAETLSEVFLKKPVSITPEQTLTLDGNEYDKLISLWRKETA